MSPVASAYEARLNAALPSHCFSWSLPPEEVEALDDEVVFCRSAEALGLPVPVAHRVSSHAEVIAWNERLAALVAAEPDAKHPRYIFKNLQYDSMHRLDLFTLPCAADKLTAYLAVIPPIDAANPWTVQTFIVGGYWLFSEVWAALAQPGLRTAANLLDALLHKKDAYYDAHDPLPSLALLYVHLPTLLARNICK